MSKSDATAVCGELNCDEPSDHRCGDGYCYVHCRRYCGTSCPDDQADGQPDTDLLPDLGGEGG